MAIVIAAFFFCESFALHVESYVVIYHTSSLWRRRKCFLHLRIDFSLKFVGSFIVIRSAPSLAHSSARPTSAFASFAAAAAFAFASPATKYPSLVTVATTSKACADGDAGIYHPPSGLRSHIQNRGKRTFTTTAGSFCFFSSGTYCRCACYRSLSQLLPSWDAHGGGGVTERWSAALGSISVFASSKSAGAGSTGAVAIA